MFTAKEKEPKLSTEMCDILDRSMNEKNKSNSDEIFRYKYKIMNMLTSNQDLLRTLHNADLQTDGELNGDAYRDVNIFNYMKLPNQKSVVKNYVCFEVNDEAYGNFGDKIIIFRTVSHEDDCKTDWNINRQDLLASIIKNEFDWSNVFGMHIEKEYDVGRVTDDGYYYREFAYKSTVPNNHMNKLRPSFK